MNWRTIQLNILPEFMISFHEPDPDIPGLAPIVNSGGGDILRFLLAVNSEWNQELLTGDCNVAGSLTRDCLTSSTKNSSVNYLQLFYRMWDSLIQTNLVFILVLGSQYNEYL